MKKKKYVPYGLNMEFEYQTYKRVGLDYGERKNADLGMLRNMGRFGRKHLNKSEKKYAFCNTYTQWKKHVEDILPEAISNDEDMLHWLYKKRNDAMNFLEEIRNILIPIYIAILALMEPFWEGGELGRLIMTIILMFILVWISSYALRDAKDRVDFYEDFINIVKNKIGK